MLEVRSLNFILRLETNQTSNPEASGKYYLELIGESPFNTNKSFEEKFSVGTCNLPFNSLSDVALFVNETAFYWQQQLNEYPKLSITSIHELADLWLEFSKVLEQKLKLASA